MKRTRSPLQDRSKETREKIVQAALKLFREQGFATINSKDIAQAAGVAIGSFYVYFKDKKDVFKDILDIFFNDLMNLNLSRFLHHEDSQGAHDLLVQLIHTILEYVSGFGCIYKDLQILFFDDDKVREFLEQFYGRFFEVARTLLTEAGFPLPDKLPAVSQVVVLLLENTIHHLLYRPDSISRDDLIAEVANCLNIYLHAPHPSTP